MMTEPATTFAVCGLLVYIVCGVITFGSTLAYFQRKWPTLAKRMFRDDLYRALFCALMGPIAMILVLRLSEKLKYGFLFSFRFKEKNLQWEYEMLLMRPICWLLGHQLIFRYTKFNELYWKCVRCGHILTMDEAKARERKKGEVT